MIFIGTDPGPCIVCGAPHTTCKGPPSSDGVHIVQLPARDAAAVSGAAPLAAPRTVAAPAAPTKKLSLRDRRRQQRQK